MPAKRRVSDKEISYSQAKEDESNILHKLGIWDKRCQFFNHVHGNRAVVQAIIAHHLGVSAPSCEEGGPDDWIYGSFNLCVPYTISRGKGQPTKRVIIRFPLPYKVGGRENGDEKVRCEAGTYIWLQENCPSIPIPGLHGFGLSTGEMFTPIENLPLLPRLWHRLYRQLLTWLKLPVPSKYIRHQGPTLGSLGSGYMLIDYIEETQGEMLSCTWKERQHEPELRRNLFQGLSRILLDIARVPLPRIGSFTVDNNGFLLLGNRPLSLVVHQLENEQVPVDIPRQLTYTSADSYAMDMLNCLHDGRLRHQLNGASDGKDCILQMCALATMKAIMPLFLRRDLRHGPFSFTLTDLHQSNILVDKDWNIKCLIDLEWAVSWPIEMINTPQWLTNQSLDEMDEEIYDPIRREFLDILEKTEQELSLQSWHALSSSMKQAWEMGTFWYSLALRSPSCLCRVFYDHILPKVANGHEDNEDFYVIMMQYWTIDTTSFIREKEADKENYDRQLRQAFEDKGDDSVDKNRSADQNEGVDKHGDVGKDETVDKDESADQNECVDKHENVGKDETVDKNESADQNEGLNNGWSAKAADESVAGVPG